MVHRSRNLSRTRWTWLIMPAGVVLPTLALAVESTTHICARNAFDPIPTFWHVLLIGFVPLAHLQVWRAIRRQQLERSTLLAAANGIAIGISLFYTFVYIWLLPVAAIALLFFGLGFLPLAPLLSLIAGLVLRKQLAWEVPAGPRTSFWLTARGLIACVSIAFCFIALAELPAILTRVGLEMAGSSSPQRSERGIRFLRSKGSKDALLRACYPDSRRAIDLFGYAFARSSHVTPKQAQAIYYRVTGQTYETAGRPSRLRAGSSDLADVDPGQHNHNVPTVADSLSLGSSQMDGSVDADAGVAYLEWTLTIRNASGGDREAHTQIQLPPGGIVSRVSLLRDGGWSEATFVPTSKFLGETHSYYHPVVVTSAGPDRILLSCFRVPSHGTKVRLGITVPLLLENLAYARLLLPHFIDRNFGVTDDFKHAVWVESNSQLQSSNHGLTSEVPLTSLHALRGGIADSELSRPESSIRFARSAVREVWASSVKKGEPSIVRQFVRERVATPPTALILVVDTSRGMRESATEINAALEALPSNFALYLLFTGGTGAYAERGSLAASNTKQVARLIETVTFEGGVDNVPTLLRSLEIAEDTGPDTAIVWIHNPQPIELKGIDTLRQRLRRTNGPRLYSIQTYVGPDRVEDGLVGAGTLVTVPRLGTLKSDLGRLFASLTTNEKTFEYVRSNEAVKEPASGVDVKETSSHLAKLWANDEIGRFLRDPEAQAVDASGNNIQQEATELALQNQLVSPLSGAVVLERNHVYPIDRIETVAVPEDDADRESPFEGKLILIIVAIVLLVFGMQCGLRKSRRPTYRVST